MPCVHSVYFTGRGVYTHTHTLPVRYDTHIYTVHITGREGVCLYTQRQQRSHTATDTRQPLTVIYVIPAEWCILPGRGGVCTATAPTLPTARVCLSPSRGTVSTRGAPPPSLPVRHDMHTECVSYREGWLYTHAPPCETRHRPTLRTVQGGVAYPFKTGYLPLKYSSNPGVKWRISQGGRGARIQGGHAHTPPVRVDSSPPAVAVLPSCTCLHDGAKANI